MTTSAPHYHDCGCVIRLGDEFAERSKLCPTAVELRINFGATVIRAERTGNWTPNRRVLREWNDHFDVEVPAA